MKAGDARAMTPDQLSDELMKLKKEQFNLRFQRASGQLENTARFRVVRRDIARIMTVLGQAGAAPAKTQAKTKAVEKTAKAPAKKKAAASKPAKKPAKRASAKT